MRFLSSLRFLPSTTSRAVLAGALLALAAPVSGSFAQGAGGGAAAQAEPPQPKQVALTQPKLDGLIAAQKAIRDIESKAPKDAKGPDPKLDKEVEAAVKKNGFASVDEFADASYSVGLVLAGMDPETNKFVGVESATRKQIDEVKADKQMPPKEKKEALEELNESLKNASSEKPSQNNIALVTNNLSKLNDGLKGAD